MAICPNCGHRKLLLQPLTCDGCRKLGCERCLGVYGYTYPTVGGPGIAHRICSWDCFDRLARYNIGSGLTIVPSGGYWYIGSYQLVAPAAQRAVRIQAENYILAERHEDAAKLYESLGMWKEAGEARRLKGRLVVTHIHADVNDLMDQLRNMGVTATYTCPACRSPLQITGDTKPDALAKCAYCGAVIMPTDLIQAIAKVIGPR
jgi:hypothetical protein